MIINYQHFVPLGTKINLAKYCLARVFWNRLFRQPQFLASALLYQVHASLRALIWPLEVLATGQFSSTSRSRMCLSTQVHVTSKREILRRQKRQMKLRPL
jgi:hypothetical protein